MMQYMFPLVIKYTMSSTECKTALTTTLWHGVNVLLTLNGRCILWSRRGSVHTFNVTCTWSRRWPLREILGLWGRGGWTFLLLRYNLSCLTWEDNKWTYMDWILGETKSTPVYVISIDGKENGQGQSAGITRSCIIWQFKIRIETWYRYAGDMDKARDNGEREQAYIK